MSRIHRLACIFAALSLAACATPRTETAAPSADSLPPAAVAPSTMPVAPTPPASGQARAIGAKVRSPAPPEPAAEPAIDDLIARLRDGFSLPPVDNAEVRQHTAWFANNPAYMERVFERARPFLPHVAAEIEARGLPAELAFLPVVESAFDPFAYSHGRAAGLWQIIPGTGRRFGLKQNWWYDGRRDVVESTRAALDYLEYLHNMFGGDWLLAIAAYNCGEGSVGRAIRRNREAGQPTDFWHLRLPAETRGYVPRLLGLTAVIADPEPHQLALPEISGQPVFAAVELDGQIDLAIAAELAGIELLELQALNPGFNRWATDPDGPHRLQLPVATIEQFNAALAALPASERMVWHRHVVRPGDTLGGIARRYRTTVAVLQHVNDLPGTQIRAGSHLMVPTSTRSAEDYPLSAANRLAGTQAAAATPGRAPGADPLVRRVNYTVRRGDSLYRIASNFRVSVEDIKRWNSLDGKRHLQPGQRLILHVDVTAQSGG